MKLIFLLVSMLCLSCAYAQTNIIISPNMCMPGDVGCQSRLMLEQELVNLAKEKLLDNKKADVQQAELQIKQERATKIAQWRKDCAQINTPGDPLCNAVHNYDRFSMPIPDSFF